MKQRQVRYRVVSEVGSHLLTQVVHATLWFYVEHRDQLSCIIRRRWMPAYEDRDGRILMHEHCLLVALSRTLQSAAQHCVLSVHVLSLVCLIRNVRYNLSSNIIFPRFYKLKQPRSEAGRSTRTRTYTRYYNRSFQSPTRVRWAARRPRKHRKAALERHTRKDIEKKKSGEIKRNKRKRGQGGEIIPRHGSGQD